MLTSVTAHEWIQFTAGRTFAYLAVGLVENAIPNYNSEICPTDVRGFFTGSLLFFNVLGGVWGSGMSRAYATVMGDKAWMVSMRPDIADDQIPTAMQLIPSAIMLVCVPFTPESPRWLVLHNKREKAIRELKRLRPAREADSGFAEAEASAMEDAIEGDRMVGTGSWGDLFRGNHLRRTMVGRTSCPC